MLCFNELTLMLRNILSIKLDLDFRNISLQLVSFIFLSSSVAGS
jgi:hypothetical protein